MNGVHLHVCYHALPFRYLCKKKKETQMKDLYQKRLFSSGHCRVWDMAFVLSPPHLHFSVFSRVCSSHSQQQKAGQVQVSCAVPSIKTDEPKDQVTK